METGINFLPEIAEKEIKKGVYRRKVNVAAIGALLVVGIIIIGLIVYQLFLTSRANDLKNRTDEAEKVVGSFSEIEIKNLAVKEKLDKIETFLNKAIPGSKAIEQLSIAAEPIIIKTLSVTDSGKIQVQGEADNSSTLSTWIDNLKNDNGKEFFDNILLASLDGDPGNYKFTMLFDFLKKGVRTDGQ